MNVDSQGTFVERFAEFVRDRAGAMGITSMKLADAIGVKRSSMTNYWSGARPYPIETIPTLAAELSTNVDSLFTGREVRSRGQLRNAADADWIEVPKYDLHHMTDTGLGEPTMTVPMRKDWLMTNFRASSSIWLTRIPTDYSAAELEEGTMVLCRSIDARDLSERHLCIWRFHTNLLVGRFSVVPDAVSSLSAIPTTQAVSDRFAGEVIVSPSQIGTGDDHYHLVGRILGVFIRPL